MGVKRNVSGTIYFHTSLACLCKELVSSGGLIPLWVFHWHIWPLQGPGEVLQVALCVQALCLMGEYFASPEQSSMEEGSSLCLGAELNKGQELAVSWSKAQ